MKKTLLNILFAMLPLTMMAQLPYDTELTKDHFEGSAVISKSDHCEWTLGAIGVGDLANVPFLGLVDPKDNSCVIVLPTEGMPLQIDFQYRSLNKGTISVEESVDMNKWTSIWSQSVETELIEAVHVTGKLSTSTRYIRLHYVGYSRVYFSKIIVTEKKELSVNIDEYQFPSAMVDDAPANKEVTVNWTNVVANVTSSNPAFTVSTTKIGEKSKEGSNKLVISYNHNTYGTHSGVITIEGEGLKSTIAVTGTTNRYEQTLTWNQTLGTYSTTDNLRLNAYTNYGLPVTYTSSDASIAWVDSLGNVHVECAGTVDFTAQQLGNNKYAPTTTITKQATFTKANPIVTVSAKDITYGQTVSEIELTKTSGTVEGTFAVVDLDPDSVLDADTYDITVRFTPSNECIYNSVDRQVTLVVNKATQTITWNQEQTSLEVGETIELTAFASSGLELTYAFTKCIIDIEGDQMTGTEEGDVLVIAFQEGNKNYLPTTVVMQAFEVTDQPTVIRRIEEDPSKEELNEKGQKYFHNGQVYIYLGGHIYSAEGKRLK